MRNHLLPCESFNLQNNMAQKRMFDKSIIETDNFLDLPTSCKALYFLLGMEADDEGFVSPKRVTRLYGGSDDDIKILSAKRFVIPFENGVVVITDWKKNNWLDSRRIKRTEYIKEKEMITEEDGKYVLLSECLAPARREEKSIEENSIVDKTPHHKKIKYLSDIPESDLKEFNSRFDASIKDIKSKSESLLLYCQSKGKVYKDYKAFLLNALKKDFKERVNVPRPVYVKDDRPEMTPEQKKILDDKKKEISKLMALK